jgi:hypothetical protein
MVDTISLKSGGFTMMNSLIKGILVCLVFLRAVPITVQAQDVQPAKAPAQDPSTYLHVSAPLAQAVLLKVKAEHDIHKMGLHAVPPGETTNVIIANAIPANIGKSSSPTDLQKLADAKPVAVRNDKGGYFGTFVPITDAKGRDIAGGFIAMEVPFSKASSEEEALKFAVGVRDEIQRQIPSKAAMYRK